MTLSRARVAAIVFGSCAFAACAGQSPVTPSRAAEIGGQDQLAGKAAAAAGTFDISFLKESTSGLQPVPDLTLGVGEYLVLKSSIADASGNPVRSGQVTYEYCTRRNVAAAAAECQSGSGTWTRLLSMSVDPIGSLAGFGSCSTPRTIGFRFRYTAQGSGIANGVSPAKDVTWQ